MNGALLMVRPYTSSLFLVFRFHLTVPVSVFLSDVKKRQVAVKSTRGFALKSNHGMMVKTGPSTGGGAPGGQGGNMGKSRKSGGEGGGGENAPKNTRQFFDGEESCYIIDAKLEGNLGRYLNVSHAPPTTSPSPLLQPAGLFISDRPIYLYFSMFY